MKVNFDKQNKRFDSNEIILNEMKSDFNNKLDEQKIKCEQQNIQNEINFKEIKEQNLSLIHI